VLTEVFSDWLAHLEFELDDHGVRIPGRATIPGSGKKRIGGCADLPWPTIPLGSNFGQIVYTHCLRGFSAPRNCGTTKREFSGRLSGYGARFKLSFRQSFRVHDNSSGRNCQNASAGHGIVFNLILCSAN